MICKNRLAHSKIRVLLLLFITKKTSIETQKIFKKEKRKQKLED